ncbi:DUF4025 domain-containing protein [Bacillus atrophaeus]|nr:DUF4025 domain-containing protein [Bacillus atrophaeus]PRS03070.1 DUF4025 domain-containing protein [Bacillus atrophaeus]
MKRQGNNGKEETENSPEQKHPTEGEDVTREQISDTYYEGTIEDTDRD